MAETRLGSLIKVVNNLVANPQTVTLKEDTTKKITLTGSGGSPLIFSVVNKPKHGTVSGSAVKIYKPKANYSGKDSFTFIVSVGCLSSSPATVNITVTAVPDAPVLASIGNKSVIKNTLLTFTATATDADKGDKLSFSLIGAPATASINATSGIFMWTPTTTGNFTFKVRVTDNSTLALYDEEQITVTVTNAFAFNTQISNEEIVQKTFEAELVPNPVEIAKHLKPVGQNISPAINTYKKNYTWSRNYNGCRTFAVNKW
jgi:putative Ig domain-containing protein/Big-like domain-containing protein